MKIGYRLKMIRGQRIGILFLLTIILGIEIFIHRDTLFFGQAEAEPLPVTIQNILNSKDTSDYKTTSISSFNPNRYTEADWQNIGFSRKQASIIIKYKEMLGGEFTSKEQLKKCFVISEEKYQELASFIQLPEKSNDENTVYTNSVKYSLKKFNPNLYTLFDWQNIGFSKKQAEVILKYKEILGGKFSSKEQFKQCFVISKDKFRELSPFIMLPEKETEDNASSKGYTLVLFNPNLYTSSDWQKIGFSKKQAEVILAYKNTIGGEFVSKEQLKQCFVISEDKYKELVAFIQLPEKSNKSDLNQASVSFVKAKDYTLATFNPNLYTSEDWQKIGFSKKQAEVIIKYKNKLGGNFTSKQQIKECFVISEYKYNEIEPYIRF